MRPSFCRCFCMATRAAFIHRGGSPRVDRWLVAAEAADAEEDKLHGTKRGDEMPDWVANKEKRLAKIRAAKAELEAEAKAAAAEEERRRTEAEERRIAEGRKKNGKTPTPPSAEPDGKAQRNFTDADSRILKTKDGYIQGYLGIRPPSTPYSRNRTL
jgi:hypothetical protein